MHQKQSLSISVSWAILGKFPENCCYISSSILLHFFHFVIFFFKTITYTIFIVKNAWQKNKIKYIGSQNSQLDTLKLHIVSMIIKTKRNRFPILQCSKDFLTKMLKKNISCNKCFLLNSAKNSVLITTLSF